MSFKLNYSEVVIESNAAGEPLSVKMPFLLFQQMSAIVDAARLHEANRVGDVKPGMYRSSLSRFAAVDQAEPECEVAQNRKPAFYVPGHQTGPKPVSEKRQKLAALESLFAPAGSPAPELALTHAETSLEVELPPLPESPASSVKPAVTASNPTRSPQTRTHPTMIRPEIPDEPAERAPFARVRLARGLSREEVARRYGCSAATLSVYEAPGFRMTEGVLERLSELYEVKPRDARAAYARWRKNS